VPSLINRTCHARKGEYSRLFKGMFTYAGIEEMTDDHCGNAINGYRALRHYVVDRDGCRNSRPEDRSHFLIFGGLFFPNEAGRNCLSAV
jgi:hypothetical protein